MHSFNLTQFCLAISNLYKLMAKYCQYRCKVINVISDQKDIITCPWTLAESEITAGDCITLEVYAEQYGVQSERKTFHVCYNGKTNINIQLKQKQHFSL